MAAGVTPTSAPGTTTAWPCASRWPPSGLPPCASWTRAASARPSPIISTSTPAWCPAPPTAMTTDSTSSAGAPVPVIAIDGPTASGKGTVAHRVAKALGWAVLDSGALYRLTALAALNRSLAAEDEAGVADVARGLDTRFEGRHIYLEGVEVGEAIRQERVGNFASRIAAYPAVRQALLERQRAFRVP